MRKILNGLIWILKKMMWLLRMLLKGIGKMLEDSGNDPAAEARRNVQGAIGASKGLMMNSHPEGELKPSTRAISAKTVLRNSAESGCEHKKSLS